MTEQHNNWFKKLHEKRNNTATDYSGPYWASILADSGPPFWSILGHFIK
jgi:hypothetical protein